ncbi:MAG: ferritin family protein [Archaeoglobaceae archaeon]|nr:ferritin-like domain-containing protein [Archaeoglobaceae archaeon]MDW7990104.1 ferritin family protein [Archaeoglobaceae archaeon]
MTPEDILKKALELEKEAIEIYNEMRKNATTETADILDYLISQEREHIRIINDRLKVLKLLGKRGEK